MGDQPLSNTSNTASTITSMLESPPTTTTTMCPGAAGIPAATDAMASASLSGGGVGEVEEIGCASVPVSDTTDVSGMSASAASTPVPAPATDEQFYAYCLEASALLNNLGAAHHDRGTDGADDAMKSYSESIQTRIRAQDAAEAAEQGAGGNSPNPNRGDRPSVREMDDHLTDLRTTISEIRRINAAKRTDAGDDYVYPHDTAMSFRRNETPMVGLNAFTRPCLLPVNDDLTLSQAGSDNLSSAISGAGVHGYGASGTTAAGTTSGTAFPAPSPPGGGIMKKRRGGLKSTPSTVSSEVQKANSLAAFTLFNIGLLHQNDRSHKEARESYEIARSMLDSVPAYLTWNVTLLRVFIQNNLGYVAYRTDDLTTAAEHFQMASNGSLDLSMMYSPSTATSALHRDEALRASRRKLARSNVAILLNLSRALSRLGNHQDSMDVSNAALQLYSRMQEEEEQYQKSLAEEQQQAQPQQQPRTSPPQDDDGLDLSVIPFVRARAFQGIRDNVTAMEEYRTFLSIAESHGHNSSHPYYVASMQSIVGMSQDDALAAIEEILAQTTGEAQTAAAA